MAERIKVTVSVKLGGKPSEEGEGLFEEHGIEIVKHEERWDFLFPSSTSREEILPRMPWTERYQLVCPDGFTVLQTHSVVNSTQCVLSYSPDPPCYEVWAGKRMLHSGKDLKEASHLYEQTGFDSAYRREYIALLKNGVRIGIMHPALV